MRESWDSYALMMGITFIEEMSKPTAHIQIKHYKGHDYHCLCFHGVRLKMKNEFVVKRLFEITKNWEIQKGVSFIGKSFVAPRKEPYSGQDFFYFSPEWLNELLVSCGVLPNKYSDNAALQRIQNLVQYEYKEVDRRKNLFSLLLTDKLLAAGAFIVSMDMECHGIQSGRVCLCMSEKYFDFLEFMRQVAIKWGWTNNLQLNPVSVEASKNRGICASPQFDFKLSIKGLMDIYELAGPLADPLKDKFIKFHVNRSKRYSNLGSKHLNSDTQKRIFQMVQESGLQGQTSSAMVFSAGVGIDVILEHLHKLEKQDQVVKKRCGKGYVWWAI